MNQDHESSRDEVDELLDRAIRATMAERAPDDVKNRAIETAAALTPRHCAGSHFSTRRAWRILVSAAATILAICLIGFLFHPSTSVSWGDVVNAVKSQKWIRATAAYPDGTQGTTWLSSQSQVWAFQFGDVLLFCDGSQQAKYEYRKGSRQIVKMPLGEEDVSRVLPVGNLSQKGSVLSPWLFGSEKVVSQQRREIVESGKKWIEFELILWREQNNPVTLRIDPKTGLPVYLMCTSPADATKSYKWQFDYPDKGPADIYAMGVPAEIRIDDRMPPKDSLRVLRAIAASRARIGDFRLMVARYPGDPAGCIVWRKGDCWRVHLCSGVIGLQPLEKPQDGQKWGDWLENRLKQYLQIPLYVCDGKTVYENTDPLAHGNWPRARITAPQDLLSGEGLGHLPRAPYVKIASLVYPDLSPKPGMGFEFDPQPADSPGCVLIKRFARTTQKEPTVGHEWYYIDPAKGHAVVRVDLFSLPANTPMDPKGTQRQSIRMEDFHESPQGFWYPRVIRNTANDETVFCHFDFGIELPDWLFASDAASERKE